MSRVLGVNATSGTLWFVLAVDGVLENPDPASFELAGGKTRPDALVAGRDELAAFLARNVVDLVVLVEPEVSKTTYQASVPRIATETVLEFAAAQAGVELRRLTRAKLRSVLELGRSGSVSDHAKTVVEVPLAPHWNKKRDVAALAALACS